MGRGANPAKSEVVKLDAISQTAQRFWSSSIAPRKPAVLEGHLPDSQAAERWTNEYFVQAAVPHYLVVKRLYIAANSAPTVPAKLVYMCIA